MIFNANRDHTKLSFSCKLDWKLIYSLRTYSNKSLVMPFLLGYNCIIWMIVCYIYKSGVLNIRNRACEYVCAYNVLYEGVAENSYKQITCIGNPVVHTLNCKVLKHICVCVYK